MYALSFKIKMAYYGQFWWSITACTTYNILLKNVPNFVIFFSILLFIQIAYHYTEYVKITWTINGQNEWLSTHMTGHK